MPISGLKNRFKEIFNLEAERSFFTPGRINLIGEHIDYSGGNVFPTAITFGTYAVVTKRNDKIVRLYSENFEAHGIVEVNLDTLVFDEKDNWANYPKGVLKMLLDAGYKLEKGFDAVFFGNIPNGAGLSSSASLEVLTGLIATTLNDVEIEMLDIVKLAQKAENEFVGVQCGIMDQFASAMGKADHAIFLNCRDLSFHHVPLNLKGYKIVIANTNKKRGLADSKYNERRSQCEEAFAILKQFIPQATCLGEISMDEFNKYKHEIKDEIIRNRAEHVIVEDDRVLKSVEALNNDNIELFGRYMIASHGSLRDLYEVTGAELDTLVEEALKIEGVAGSRMTGAGFGGCTVSIVREEAVDTFVEKVGQGYAEKTGIEPSFYISEVGDGGREITK